MRANVIEAAEQCGVLAVPRVADPLPIDRIAHDGNRLLVFCDESSEVRDPVVALSAMRLDAGQPLAVLIGPEGGFADEERAALLKRPKVVQIALGPRILRADTAAVAALALVQAILGDWSKSTG
jgi:16S rRNA (uracil1498-N3)-methyltransferase